MRHDTIGPAMERATFRSRLGVLALSVRGFAATTEGVSYDSAALGRDAERAPAGVPTLGAADALEVMDPTVFRKLSNDAMYRSRRRSEGSALGSTSLLPHRSTDAEISANR